MPLRADLLNPIAGDNPSGSDIRYDGKLAVYDQIKEARRADDDLAQGEWQHERKVADFPKVVKLGQEVLATRSKDLQVAVWVTEALLRTEGFAGLQQGLTLCHDLIANFWDTLYPPIEDGDEESRSAPLDALGSSMLDLAVRARPLVKSGYDFIKYKESRMVGYAEKAQSDKEKAVRAERVEEGKLQPEDFDKAFLETPKVFYVNLEKDLDGCLVALDNLGTVCDQKFQQAPPSFGKLKTTVEEIRHTVHLLLEKKRETEPDAVAESTAVGVGEAAPVQARAMAAAAGAGSTGFTISVMNSSEPVERRELIANVAKAAAYLRALEPHSPAPYLMMRGLRWGELRAAARISDATLLEAPPVELRQQLKRLGLAQRWKELLETAENAMSLPCSRAWLDLQRNVVMACTELGGDYDSIAAAIRSELKTLLKDVPELLNATLLDDTPAANGETRAWLESLLNDDPQPPGTATATEAPAEGEVQAEAPPSWPAKAADKYALAQDLLQRGQAAKAIEMLQREIDRQRSGRGRFERKLQLVRLLVSAGQPEVAQPLLDDIAVAIESHKLDEWEDKELIASALATLMSASSRVQEDAAERQKIFERICRLDPVRALKAE